MTAWALREKKGGWGNRTKDEGIIREKGGESTEDLGKIAKQSLNQPIKIEKKTSSKQAKTKKTIKQEI